MDVYRTQVRRARIHERGEVLGTGGVAEVDVALDLRPFEDGGWYWFDLTTDGDALIAARRWLVRPVEAPGTAAVDDRHADVQPAGRLRRPRSPRSAKTRWCSRLVNR